MAFVIRCSLKPSDKRSVRAGRKNGSTERRSFRQSAQLGDPRRHPEAHSCLQAETRVAKGTAGWPSQRRETIHSRCPEMLEVRDRGTRPDVCGLAGCGGTRCWQE